MKIFKFNSFYQVYSLALLIKLNWFHPVYSLTKVVVPSVYKEWDNGSPDWITDKSIQEKYNFTTFVYQKTDPAKPNYFSTNRGTEGGVYLKYIVEHYHDFPDVG